jgi:hypothetical protein
VRQNLELAPRDAHVRDPDWTIERVHATFPKLAEPAHARRRPRRHGVPSAMPRQVPAMSLPGLRATEWVIQMADIETNASQLIDERISELGDWRGKTLSKVRRIIKEADPQIVEEWKWVKATSPGTPVWSHNGGICTGEPYKNVVKLTFFKGAALPDPSGLFNSSLDGKVRRAIDIKEDDTVDEGALQNLVREAVALNLKDR